MKLNRQAMPPIPPRNLTALPMQPHNVKTLRQSQPLPRKKFIVYARHFRIPLGTTTKIMGIINVTPDSFSQDGCLVDGIHDIQRTVERAQRMVQDGADIIDIGGESTRPGARRISDSEEIKRIVPVIRMFVKKIKKPISADTYKPRVAKHALDAGASIINTIMGTKPDTALLKMIKKYKAAIVLMHIRGTPQTMQKHIHYKNVIAEIVLELQKSIEKCLEIGIKSDRIIIDPGIGFGKTAEHNLEIIRRLRDFSVLNLPILIGTSRKSFIGKVLKKDVPQRMMGTAASVCAAICNGTHIVRVHDVGEMRDVAAVTDAIHNTARWRRA